MSTVDDDGFDWNTLSQAEGDDQAAEPAAEQADGAAGDVPRDPETGRFVKAEEEAAPEAEDAGADTSDLDAILAKYGTIEKAASAFQEAQRHIGELHRSQGELTGQLQTYAAMLQEMQNQSQQPPPPKIQQDFEQLVEDNPREAMLLALQAQDMSAYSRAKESANDYAPGFGDVIENELRMMQTVDQLTRNYAQLAQPIQQQQQRQTVAEVYREVAKDNPDFEDLRPHMTQVVEQIHQAGGYDWITPSLESGDPHAAKAALNTLVLLARALSSGNLAEAAQDAARRHVEATEKARAEAIVASATQTVASSPDQATAADALWDQWASLDVGRLRDS